MLTVGRSARDLLLGTLAAWSKKQKKLSEVAAPSITLGAGRYFGWKFEARLLQTIRLAIHRDDSINEAEYEGNDVAANYQWRCAHMTAQLQMGNGIAFTSKKSSMEQVYEPSRRDPCQRGGTACASEVKTKGRYASQTQGAGSRRQLCFAGYTWWFLWSLPLARTSGAMHCGDIHLRMCVAGQGLNLDVLDWSYLLKEHILWELIGDVSPAYVSLIACYRVWLETCCFGVVFVVVFADVVGTAPWNMHVFALPRLKSYAWCWHDTKLMLRHVRVGCGVGGVMLTFLCTCIMKLMLRHVRVACWVGWC